MNIFNKALEETLAEARYNAEAYKAFRDDDIRLGDMTSADRWNRLYRQEVFRVRMYEHMINDCVRRVG